MIYLVKEETEYLLKLLEKQKVWWIRDSLIDKIKYDKETKLERGDCEHSFHEYMGEKQCCSKCGTIAEGMCVSWKMGNEIDPADYKMPKLIPAIPLFEPSPTG
jgi:hypothetical protein